MGKKKASRGLRPSRKKTAKKAGVASGGVTKGAASPGAGPLEPDLKAAVARVLRLLAIPGISGHEAAIQKAVIEELRAARLPTSAVRIDQAQKSSPLGGETGNLIVSLPGTVRGPRRLLMAHLDTVPLCAGAKPRREGEYIVSADKTTGLGADDRAGVAVVLTACLEILQRGLPHPPVTFFFPIQEEVGLFGARYVKAADLGRPKLAFNWDGNAAEQTTIGATGAYRLNIKLTGLASHAGVAPQKGVSAVAIAALAIAELHRDGWHGDVTKQGRHGTSNVGVIHGGAATNVVTDAVELRAEVRSHDPEFRKEMLAAFQTAFARAAESVRNIDGRPGAAEVVSRLDYEAFLLAEDEPAVRAAQAAIRAIGREPRVVVSNGGLDANWMTAHGIPTVTMGCGQESVHTTSERLNVAAFENACRVALRLATGTESEGSSGGEAGR